MSRLLLAAVFAFAGCSKPTPPPAAAPDAAAVDAAAPAKPKISPRKNRTRKNRKKRKKRKRLKLPPPSAPPPRPEGEPSSAGDFQKLAGAAQQGAPVEKPGAPPIQRLDAYRLRVGKVFVDRLERTVEIPAQVNMVEGILEYFAVCTQGKLHEAVLELFAEPSHIHLGLVLVGLEPNVYDRSDPMKPPKIVKQGGDLRTWVKFKDPKTGAEKKLAAAEWLYNREKKKGPPQQVWTFQGSSFWNGRYAADMDRSVSSLIPDETAVIGTKVDIGNPYRGDNLGFEVHKAVIPPKGTKVTYVLEVIGPKPPKPGAAVPTGPRPNPGAPAPPLPGAP